MRKNIVNVHTFKDVQSYQSLVIADLGSKEVPDMSLAEVVRYLERAV